MSLGPRCSCSTSACPDVASVPGLLGLFAQIDRPRSQFQVEIDRLPLQLAYLEFHAMSLRRLQSAVNVEHRPESAGPY